MDRSDREGIIPDVSRPSAVRRKKAGTAVILLIGAVVCAGIWALGKTVFVSNSGTSPRGMDTATIRLNSDEPVEESSEEQGGETSAAAVTVPVEVVNSETSTSVTEEPADETLGVMYITEYVQLHKEPSSDSENIVCMSPGIAVNVLEYDETGFVKITFQNVDGPATGYVWKDYLSEVQTVKPAWEQ